jgi:hypothetical protein
VALTSVHPEALIRGLIPTAAASTTVSARRYPAGEWRGYSYVRYFFTNVSADIRQIFTEHCALLGIRLTQSNRRNLSISHRRSVEILEQLVGPKR